MIAQNNYITPATTHEIFCDRQILEKNVCTVRQYIGYSQTSTKPTTQEGIIVRYSRRVWGTQEISQTDLMCLNETYSKVYSRTFVLIIFLSKIV
jgi:hypothetical protein